jgi:hypothetical protein
MQRRFEKGELVTFKRDLPNKPVMIVREIVKMTFRDEIEDAKMPMLVGIRCLWFTTNMQMQEAMFNTKDLMHYEDI